MQKSETHFRQDWRATSPNRLTQACWAAGHWVWHPDWGRTPLWVWVCHLEHLNQKETGQKKEGRRGGKGTVRGRGGGWSGSQKVWQKYKPTHKDRHVTAQKNEPNTHTQINTQTEETCLAKMKQKQNSHQQQPQKKALSADCVRCVCEVNSPSHAYAMQKKPRPPEEWVCATPGQGRKE